MKNDIAPFFSLVAVLMIFPLLSFSQKNFIGKTVVSIDTSKDYNGLKVVDVVLKGSITEMGKNGNTPIDIEYFNANILPNKELASP